MTPKRGPRKLVLLHLSDIHLRKEEIESGQDLDDDIRQKLAADISRCGLPVDSNVDAVLVTGDLAFRGAEVEYRSARQWLKSLCERIGCPESQVWVVPGNHDVDRSVVSRSRLLQDSHEVIRKHPNPAQALSERLREDVSAQALLSPLVEYNRFAEQFRCETTPNSVFWESSDEEDDLVLNDGSHLRLRGINSAIISDESGDKGPRQEVVGLKQIQLRDEDNGICYLTLCHHPYDWLLDGEAVEDALTSRARIQLFGHKHRARARQHDNSLVIGAGALHPERKGRDWHPRYNVLRLEVRGESPNRRLVVEVYQRGWKEADTNFGQEVESDGQYPKIVELKLGPWTLPAPKAGEGAPPTPLPTKSEDQAKQSMISTRELVFRLFALSYPDRMQIVVDLKLLDDADSGVPESEIVKRAIRRAKERGQLAELEDAIKTATPKE